MTNGIVRERLHKFIDTIDDKKEKAIYFLFENEMDDDAQRKLLIERERQKYLEGAGSAFSWEQVKDMARNKSKRNAL